MIKRIETLIVKSLFYSLDWRVGSSGRKCNRCVVVALIKLEQWNSYYCCIKYLIFSRVSYQKKRLIFFNSSSGLDLFKRLKLVCRRTSFAMHVFNFRYRPTYIKLMSYQANRLPYFDMKMPISDHVRPPGISNIMMFLSF